MLCVTRYPWNTSVDPSSIDTGIETSTAFLHCERTRIRFGIEPEDLADAAELRLRELVGVLAEMRVRRGG